MRLAVVIPPPTVDAADPAEGTQGDTLAVAINGADFQNGASSNFGADITVNSTNFVSSTELTANITIAAAAALGPRTVTVTNPDGQSGSRANAFNVLPVVIPPPTVDAVDAVTSCRCRPPDSPRSSRRSCGTS